VALRRARGFNLPELMISLAIGSLLLAAFLSILDRARREFTANESLAQLQDGARQALAVLVPDLEHAGFYGFASPTSAQLTRGGNVVAGSVELRQPFLEPVPPARGLPAGAHDCGVNFAVDLVQAVQGANNSFPPGIEARDCEATASAGGVRAGTDSLTVRHASLAATRPRAGRLQLYARRQESHGPLMLFADGHAPGPLDEGAEVRNIEVRTYYIANHSIGRPGWPALRLKALTESRGVPQFRDEENQPGIEEYATYRRTRAKRARVVSSRCGCGCASARKSRSAASPTRVRSIMPACTSHRMRVSQRNVACWSNAPWRSETPVRGEDAKT
jgi:prepilin-type N-terminal cleavage/methylation domain-containing protein